LENEDIKYFGGEWKMFCLLFQWNRFIHSIPFVWTGKHLNLVWISLCRCGLGKVDTC